MWKVIHFSKVHELQWEAVGASQLFGGFYGQISLTVLDLAVVLLGYACPDGKIFLAEIVDDRSHGI